MPQWSVGGWCWSPLQCQDVIAEARVETASKTQELWIEPMSHGISWISSLYSWYSSQGSTWIIAVIAPKVIPTKIPAFSVLVVCFLGIVLDSIHGLKFDSATPIDRGNEMHNFGIRPWNVPLHCCNSPRRSEWWDDRWFSPFHVFQVIHWPGESKPGHQPCGGFRVEDVPLVIL